MATTPATAGRSSTGTEEIAAFAVSLDTRPDAMVLDGPVGRRHRPGRPARPGRPSRRGSSRLAVEARRRAGVPP